jgi:hypothetical protein
MSVVFESHNDVKTIVAIEKALKRSIESRDALVKEIAIKDVFFLLNQMKVEKTFIAENRYHNFKED